MLSASVGFWVVYLWGRGAEHHLTLSRNLVWCSQPAWARGTEVQSWEQPHLLALVAETLQWGNGEQQSTAACESLRCRNKQLLGKLLNLTFSFCFFPPPPSGKRTCLAVYLVTYERPEWLAQGCAQFTGWTGYKPWPCVLLCLLGLWSSGWSLLNLRSVVNISWCAESGTIEMARSRLTPEQEPSHYCELQSFPTAAAALLRAWRGPGVESCNLAPCCGQVQAVAVALWTLVGSCVPAVTYSPLPCSKFPCAPGSCFLPALLSLTLSPNKIYRRH